MSSQTQVLIPTNFSIIRYFGLFVMCFNLEVSWVESVVECHQNVLRQSQLFSNLPHHRCCRIGQNHHHYSHTCNIHHHNHNIITINYSIIIFISLLSSSTIQQFIILDFTAKMMILCNAITAHLRCKRLLFHGIGFDQSAEYLIIRPCFLKLLRQPTSNVHHGSRYINNYNIDFNKTHFFFY